MKTIKKYGWLFIFPIFLLNTISCSLTESPSSYYEASQYFTSYQKAKMSVVGIFDCLSTPKHYGQFEMAMPCSDDIYYIKGTGTDNTRRDIAHYLVNSNNKWITTLYQYKYDGINRANVAIKGIESMSSYEEDESLQELVAEAKFLRAFLSFDIIKYWGDAPYSLEPTSSYSTAFRGRIKRDVIYDAIVEDLTFAKEHLTKASSATSPEVPCSGAAKALLMRVLLQRAGYSLSLEGDFSQPSEDLRTKCFNDIIKLWESFESDSYHGFYDEGYLELFKGYSSGILSQKESLWEIAFNPTGDSFSEDAGTWGTYNGPQVQAPGKSSSLQMGRANAFFRVLPAWRGFYEEQDLRRDVAICTYKYDWDKASASHVKVENKVKDWYPGKWRREWMPLGFVNPNNVPVNLCPLRYADVVLMAAEAYNELGESDKAIELINRVRTRANATPISLANYSEFMKAPKVYDLPFIDDSDSKGKVRTMLFWERGFELAFEGQRKYDLIRWGIIAEALKLAQDKMDPSLKGKYIAGEQFTKGKHELFPIPLTELQANPELNNNNNPNY